MTTADLGAASLAARQHGLATRAQLLELGASPSTIDRRVRTGRWRVVDPGVYLLGGFELDPKVWTMAATLVVPGAVASHLSAARLHQLEPLPPGAGRHHVSVTGRRTQRRPWLSVHQTASLSPADVAVVDGVSTTTVERTVVDLAAVFVSGRCAQLVDNAITGGVDLAGIIRTFERVAERGRPGTDRMRQLLDERANQTAFSTTELEQRLLSAVRAAGLPEPESQYLPPFAADHGFGRVDYAYPEARLLIEADGRRWHSRSHDFERDRRRDQTASAAGWATLRFTWSDIMGDPAYVVSVIRRCLQQPMAG